MPANEYAGNEFALYSVFPRRIGAPEYAPIFALDMSRVDNEVIFFAMKSKSAAFISPEISREVASMFSPTTVERFPDVDVTEIADALKPTVVISEMSVNFIFIVMLN